MVSKRRLFGNIGVFCCTFCYIFEDACGSVFCIIG